MSRSTCQLQTLDRCAADSTGLSFAIVDPGDAAVIAVDARHIPKVAEGRASGINAILQDLPDIAMQALNLGQRQVRAQGLGLNAAEKQGFIGVDIAHARYQALIEQGIFDRAFSPLELLAEVGDREFVRERLGSEIGNAGHHRCDRAIGRHPPHLPEGALIDKSQLSLLWKEQSNPTVLL